MTSPFADIMVSCHVLFTMLLKQEDLFGLALDKSPGGKETN